LNFFEIFFTFKRFSLDGFSAVDGRSIITHHGTQRIRPPMLSPRGDRGSSILFSQSAPFNHGLVDLRG
jgi:hypothetical protein